MSDPSKPYQCTECSKAFKRKGDLNRHYFIHSGQKEHKCRTCSKAFTQATALKTHLNVHSKRKPFKCGIDGCAAAFGDPSSCSRHKREKHSGFIGYQCPGCKTSIKRRAAYVKHLTEKHAIDADTVNIDDHKLYTISERLEEEPIIPAATIPAATKRRHDDDDDDDEYTSPRKRRSRDEDEEESIRPATRTRRQPPRYNPSGGAGSSSQASGSYSVAGSATQSSSATATSQSLRSVHYSQAISGPSSQSSYMARIRLPSASLASYTASELTQAVPVQPLSQATPVRPLSQAVPVQPLPQAAFRQLDPVFDFGVLDSNTVRPSFLAHTSAGGRLSYADIFGTEHRGWSGDQPLGVSELLSLDVASLGARIVPSSNQHAPNLAWSDEPPLPAHTHSAHTHSAHTHSSAATPSSSGASPRQLSTQTSPSPNRPPGVLPIISDNTDQSHSEGQYLAANSRYYYASTRRNPYQSNGSLPDGTGYPDIY